jgi:hypothetical protein
VRPGGLHDHLARVRADRVRSVGGLADDKLRLENKKRLKTHKLVKGASQKAFQLGYCRAVVWFYCLLRGLVGIALAHRVRHTHYKVEPDCRQKGPKLSRTVAPAHQERHGGGARERSLRALSARGEILRRASELWRARRRAADYLCEDTWSMTCVNKHHGAPLLSRRVDLGFESRCHSRELETCLQNSVAPGRTGSGRLCTL